ncbi:hypothetical protein JTE90_006633 [Oedothorax gibbosus]|uniref:Uncharacterized protein n=1 Tax=Oedothorax gibbosus TaxID=931172 RepID=A0AAV6U782_9ARAC|nr:hypothetical protein JTE90_006633 [Oedothorax gibbosus]
MKYLSANGEETPTSLKAKQGKILTIDKALETKRKRLSSPLPLFCKYIDDSSQKQEKEEISVVSEKIDTPTQVHLK